MRLKILKKEYTLHALDINIYKLHTKNTKDMHMSTYIIYTVTQIQLNTGAIVDYEKLSILIR